MVPISRREFWSYWSTRCPTSVHIVLVSSLQFCRPLQLSNTVSDRSTSLRGCDAEILFAMMALYLYFHLVLFLECLISSEHITRNWFIAYNLICFSSSSIFTYNLEQRGRFVRDVTLAWHKQPTIQLLAPVLISSLLIFETKEKSFHRKMRIIELCMKRFTEPYTKVNQIAT